MSSINSRGTVALSILGTTVSATRSIFVLLRAMEIQYLLLLHHLHLKVQFYKYLQWIHIRYFPSTATKSRHVPLTASTPATHAPPPPRICLKHTSESCSLHVIAKKQAGRHERTDDRPADGGVLVYVYLALQ
jgi:hypothetical protein